MGLTRIVVVPSRFRQRGFIGQPGGSGTKPGPAGSNTVINLGGTGRGFRRNDVMYMSEPQISPIGGATSVANLLLAWPFRTGIGGTIANLIVNVVVAAAPAFMMGIYSNVSPVQIYPGALLAFSGGITSTPVGLKTVAVNLVVAPADLIWLAFIMQAGGGNYSTMGGGNLDNPPHGGHAIANPPGGTGNHYEFPNGSFALPNPFPAGATLVSAATQQAAVTPFVQWA